MFQDATAIFRSTPVITPLRKHLRITGRVQGVGFRPFVYRLANELALTGHVRNDPAGVSIEAQGCPDQLNRFIAAIRTQAPAAAAIRDITETLLRPADSETQFAIVSTESQGAAITEATPDLALCADCLADIRDPKNPHRHSYALTNCTNCGPRFSIVQTIPYDRCNTTMSAFTMCDSCQQEYEAPEDRRFHAQPNACKTCGPQVQLIISSTNVEAGSEVLRRAGSDTDDPIAAAAELLRAGSIVAIKGIGGYHLAVAANNAEAVDRLRQLKHRPAKPFALMCPSLQSVRRYVQLTDSAEKLLSSPAAPIVLADRLDNPDIAAGVAPDSHRLGIMLAYTPLHHLLFDALGAIDCLVMTSGNDVDEPLAFDDNLELLKPICDAILTHDRPIERAVDDSVILDMPRAPIFLRRSRGFTPEPISLPELAGISPGLSLGAEMKNTVALVQNGQVILSQHLGNLTRARTFEAFKSAIDDLCRLFDAKPRWIAHDLHPQYLSTQHARHLAAGWRVPLIPVQHHHAHAAGVLAEHQITEPALAVVCDGTGYGTDGTIWGGEILEIDGPGFRRVARLRPLRLAGGDASAKHPWRSALSLLHQAYGNDFFKQPAAQLVRWAGDPRNAEADIQFVGQMLINNTACVRTSSTGRIFDGIAALLGLCHDNRYDAQAPAILESTAAVAEIESPIERGFTLCETGGLTEIDLSPLVRQIVEGVFRGEAAAALAMLFHVSLADAFAAAVTRAMRQTARRTVALSGGVFCNALFTQLLTDRLEQTGATVLRHKVVPPNDGGIAFGQAIVAARGMGVPPMLKSDRQRHGSVICTAHGREAQAT